MKKLVVYHNGECSKCKETSELLNDKGYEIEYRFYLFDPPTKTELKEILAKLGNNPSEVVRKSEPLFIEQFEGKTISEAEWLDIIVANPILMQRPVVVNGDRAVIARPPGKVLDIL